MMKIIHISLPNTPRENKNFIREILGRKLANEAKVFDYCKSYILKEARMQKEIQKNVFFYCDEQQAPRLKEALEKK